MINSNENLFSKIKSMSIINTSGKTINIDDLIKDFIGTEKEKKLRTIFAHLDSFDGTLDNVITFNHMKNAKGNSSTIGPFEELCMFFELEKQEITEERVKMLLGENTNITVSDIEDAMSTIYNKVKDFANSYGKKNEKELENDKKNVTKIVSKYGIPENIKNELDNITDIKNIKILNIDNNKYYKIDYGKDSLTYRENGSLYSESLNYDYDDECIAQNYGYGDVVETENTYYGDNEEMIRKDIIYYSGIQQSINTLQNEMIVKYGKTSLLYNVINNVERLNSITINIGLPNQIAINVQTDDNGKVVDVLLSQDAIYSLSDEHKANLIKVLNNKLFGSDFDIKANINEIIIEKIKQEK